MAELQGRYRIAMKRLAEVEVVPGVSNQHELNGVAAIKQLLGTPSDVLRFEDVEWVLLRDEGGPARERHGLSWYDSRRGNPKRSAEWRLYYRDGTTAAEAGDLFALIRREADGALAALVAPAGSTWGRQLVEVFGGPLDPGGRFTIVDFGNVPDLFIAAASELFQLLGWDEELSPGAEAPFAEEAVERFGLSFPSTVTFSRFIQDRVPVDAREPDHALLTWWNAEDAHFREHERRIVERRLAAGFVSVEDFLSYSKSVHNRRSSRAGLALENHLRAILKRNSVRHDYKARTEGKSEPDFLFPGVNEYRDCTFDEKRLTMLAAKTTCKDRWRQVLPEAERIKSKHLCTLEPSISRAQLREMASNRLTLVAPSEILPTYDVPTGYEVISLAGFIQLVQERDAGA